MNHSGAESFRGNSICFDGMSGSQEKCLAHKRMSGSQEHVCISITFFSIFFIVEFKSTLKFLFVPTFEENRIFMLDVAFFVQLIFGDRNIIF